MLNVVGFGRRLTEGALLKLRESADRCSVKTVKALGVSAKFRCTSPKELGRFRSVGGEPVILRFLETRVKPGDCFYDVGANVGFYSVLAAHLVGPQGSVVAFEPEADNFARLQSNVLLNDLRNVVVSPFALSDHNGSGSLRLQSHTVGEGAHAVLEGGGGDSTIFMLTMDSAIPMFGLPWPNHVKIDVETHEEQVIAGMTQVLRTPALRTLAIEAHYYTQFPNHRLYFDDAQLAAKRERIVSFLTEYGFKVEAEQLTTEGQVRFAHMVLARL